MVEIPTPCKEEVEKYLKKWDDDETISLHDSSLKLLFEDLFPDNKKKEHILIKVNTLNLILPQIFKDKNRLDLLNSLC